MEKKFQRNRIFLILAAVSCAGLLFLYALENQNESYAFWQTAEMTALCILSFQLCFEDITRKKISDRWILLGILIRFLFLLAEDLFTSQSLFQIGRDFGFVIFQSLIFSLPLFLLTIFLEMVFKKKILGGGDLKFIFMAGLYFIWPAGLMGLLIGFFMGAVKVLVLSIFKKKNVKISLIPCLFAGYMVSFEFAVSLIQYLME